MFLFGCGDKSARTHTQNEFAHIYWMQSVICIIFTLQMHALKNMLNILPGINGHGVVFSLLDFQQKGSKKVIIFVVSARVFGRSLTHHK